ncbi:hypothetical protein L1987_08806 [Smallanthus sonchifolius]|uniref:Uncharacterized protein n=1 Tax=Smallanthus sonchifolius TaxID=185202 RepID=A0ACB9JL83_9ASTR|nr:hypothetical protein L1987_08806 [Smallanthus sonchifolius]
MHGGNRVSKNPNFQDLDALSVSFFVSNFNLSLIVKDLWRQCGIRYGPAQTVLRKAFKEVVGGSFGNGSNDPKQGGGQAVKDMANEVTREVVLDPNDMLVLQDEKCCIMGQFNALFQCLNLIDRNFVLHERIVWVEIVGLPLCALEKVYEMLVGTWGDYPFLDQDRDESMAIGRVCIQTMEKDEVSSKESESVEYYEDELKWEEQIKQDNEIVEHQMQEEWGIMQEEKATAGGGTLCKSCDEIVPLESQYSTTWIKRGKSQSPSRRGKLKNHKVRSSSVGKELNGFSFASEISKFIELGKTLGIKMDCNERDFQNLISGIGGNVVDRGML